MVKFATFFLLSIVTALASCKKNIEESIVEPHARYKDKLFFSVNKTTIEFDVQPDYAGNTETLYADLYQPAGDHETARAIIIYAHGGGLTRDDNNIPYLCEDLAKRGYVVASIDYRFGVEDSSTMAKGRARLRAVQDVKSFIRFAKQHAAAAKIDSNRMFITGSSAGGVAVFATAFMDYGEQPEYLNPLTREDIQGYGNLNGSNASIKAIYSMWGAVDDTTWIHRGDIPVGCIQSLGDPTVPWDYSPTARNGPGYGAYGSHSIHIRAKNMGIYSTLFGYESDRHSLGMNFPYIDTTINQLTAFFFPLTK